MRALGLVIVLLAVPAPVRAEQWPGNVLVGPLLGYRLGGPPGGRLVLGFEGGIGVFAERFNLGFEHRLGHELYYVEVDPWLYVGASLGVGVDSNGEAQGIVGLWEGLPLNDQTCSGPGWHNLSTLAFGYRYSGVHELYVTLKTGATEDLGCTH